MADDPAIDPIAIMRGLLRLWDKPAPAPESGDTPGERMMAQALAFANLPSRSEMAEIALRLDRIEESLGRLERRLDAIAEVRLDKPRKRKR